MQGETVSVQVGLLTYSLVVFIHRATQIDRRTVSQFQTEKARKTHDMTVKLPRWATSRQQATAETKQSRDVSQADGDDADTAGGAWTGGNRRVHHFPVAGASTMSTRCRSKR